MFHYLKKLIKREEGQIMSEYAFVLAMFLAVSLIMLLLLAAFSEYSWRLISLVAFEYP